MRDSGGREPAGNQAPHPGPGDIAVLTSPTQRAMPEPPNLEPKKADRRAVHGHSIVADVSTNNRAQPAAHFRNGIMHATSELGLHLVQLRLQSLTNRLP